ncbi:MAG: response regulator transcription factor [Dehalococcoidia bacterium]|nr:response regulator transcription factor [Dehalococcoidia bacterium]
MNKIRVLIVDDHAMFRQGICALLKSCDDIEIVGEASDGKEAIEKVQQLVPHVVLMDIGMPGMGGLEATRRIHKESPGSKVVALTQHEDREYVLSLFRAGARGYIPKTATTSELASGIRAVHKGDSFIHPSVATTFVEEYLMRAGDVKDEYERLTDREREILQLIAEGHTNKVIAERLFISVKTVLRHREGIMEKLGFRNRTELIKYAISKGLIEMPLKP